MINKYKLYNKNKIMNNICKMLVNIRSNNFPLEWKMETFIKKPIHNQTLRFKLSSSAWDKQKSANSALV